MSFKLATLEIAALPVAAIGVGDGYWPLSSAERHGLGALPHDVKAALQDWDHAFPRLQAFAAAVSDGAIPEQDRLPAIAKPSLPIRTPNKLIAVGANYHDHLVEMNAVHPRGDFPFMFLKPPTTALTGPGPIPIPRGCAAFDWEIELAVVIGRRLRYAEPAEAFAAIAGYTIGVDFTARDLFIWPESYFKHNFLRGKCHDAATPIGPAVTPAAFVGNPQDVAMRLWVNGAIKQDSRSSQMIWKLDELVSWASKFVTLEPGDVILSGSPAGVGAPRGEWLHPGDRVRAEIEGLGALEIDLVAG